MKSRHIIALFLTCIALTFAVRTRAMAPEYTDYALKNSGDLQAIISGYHHAPNLWQDGLKWWHGSWINENGEYYRPAVSYIHWYQVHLGLNYGWAFASAITLALYGIVCGWAGVVAYRFTKSPWCAVAASAFLCLIPYDSHAIQEAKAAGYQAADIFSWAPMADNYLCIAFLAPCVLLFDLWNESGKRGHFIGALACGVLAVCSKEYGWGFPAFWLAIALYRNSPEVSRAKLRFVAVGFATVAGFYVLRKLTVPGALGGFVYMPAVELRVAAKMFTDVLAVDGLSVATVAVLDKAAVILWSAFLIPFHVWLCVTAWKQRGPSVTALLCAFVVLSTLPLTGQQLDGHREIFVTFWMGVAGVVCVMDLVTESSALRAAVLGRLRLLRRSRHTYPHPIRLFRHR